ncbi:hypothetical protein ACFRAE_17440 [Sphingobacterium sp. HJSM2_6]|uniref:hypothetical protein n=1 Tax=Sphingobacterium sp. HJSM2_6 TaxID=3366264 RepID=UPI003BBB1556
MIDKTDSNRVKVIGIGELGKDIVSVLINKYSFSDLKFISFDEDKDLSEFYIKFPGEKKYVYGEKHRVHVIEEYDKDELNSYFSSLDSSTIFIFCLVEPIAHAILEILFSSEFPLFVRIPFKFENTSNYAQTIAMVKLLKCRKNTILLDSEIYSSQVKPVPFPGLYHQMIYGLANELAVLLKLFPKVVEVTLLPLNYLYRPRVTFIFQQDDIVYTEKELIKRLQIYLFDIQHNNLNKLILELHNDGLYCFYYVDKVSSMDLILLLMILSPFTNNLNIVGAYIWGDNSHDLFRVFVDDDEYGPFPKEYHVLQRVYNYYLNYLKQDDNYDVLFEKVQKMNSAYILELRKNYTKVEVTSSLTIVNQ